MDKIFHKFQMFPDIYQMSFLPIFGYNIVFLKKFWSIFVFSQVDV